MGERLIAGSRQGYRNRDGLGSKILALVQADCYAEKDRGYRPIAINRRRSATRRSRFNRSRRAVPIPSGVSGSMMAPSNRKWSAHRCRLGLYKGVGRVAAETRVGQVGLDRQPAVFPADDVIDLVWGEGIVFAQKTILALVEGAPRHQAAEGVADVTRHCRYAGGREPWP